MTPTIVDWRPFTAIAEPRTFGLLLRRCLQNASLTMTTGSAPGRSSSARKQRPSAGETPSDANALNVMGDPDTIAGSNDFPVTVVCCTDTAASWLNDFDRSRKST